jgi:hypothetical protein
MMESLEALFTWQAVVACLAIYAIIFVVRTVVEGLWKSAKDNRYWRDIVLPISGIVIGGLFGLVAYVFPWPEGFADHVSNRVIFGAVCGIFVNHVYSTVKSWLSSKLKSNK